MNNEPVAWIARGDNTSVFFDLDCALSIDDSPTPLYTHPAKTLTDEEIYKIANSIETIQPQHGLRLSNDLNVMDFAIAILRKAQEK